MDMSTVVGVLVVVAFGVFLFFKMKKKPDSNNNVSGSITGGKPSDNGRVSKK